MTRTRNEAGEFILSDGARVPFVAIWRDFGNEPAQKRAGSTKQREWLRTRCGEVAAFGGREFLCRQARGHTNNHRGKHQDGPTLEWMYWDSAGLPVRPQMPVRQKRGGSEP